jgi:hypothetical protein
MPLINLRNQTKFKSLKYGNDRPGGGSSNQPYITKDIPDDNNKSNIFRTGGPDVLLRGGLITPLRAANDVSRLTQMFFDLKSPNGLLFIGKQFVLSRTAVKTEASKGPAYGGGGVNAGIYTPLSTIAQAGVGFTGTHLNLLGLDPSSPITGVVEGNGIFPKLGLNRYFDKVSENNKNNNNRLVLLTKSKIYNENFFPDRRLPAGDGTGISEDDLEILRYPGGPGSILGIGKTSTKFSTTPIDTNPARTSGKKVFPQNKRKIDFTKNSWIFPLTRGASWAYEDYIGKPGKLTFKDGVVFKDGGVIGESIITENGGYTFNQNWEFRTTISGSLESRDDIKTYQTSRKIDIEKDKWVYPTDDISSKYEKFKGEKFKIKIESGSYSWIARDEKNNNISSNTATISGSLESREDIKTYQTSIDLAPIPKNKIEEDFRKDPKNIQTLSPAYNKNKNIEQRVNIGDPGAGTRLDRVNYKTGRVLLDEINASSIYSGVSPDHSQSTNKNDLVKFSIGVVQSGNSEQADYMNFRAYIDSFSDSYTSDWGEVKYVGRGDKFYNYQGFDRSISMAFTIYAHSKAELIPMYKKLNYLASSLAPSYSTGGFMQGNLHRLTLGGYLYNQLGILKSVTYDVPQESTWEIGIDTDGGFDSTVKELPHMIKVSNITFIPIQNFVPRRANPSNQVDTRFIALEAGTNNTSY